jgi:hypothetical protein
MPESASAQPATHVPLLPFTPPQEGVSMQLASGSYERSKPDSRLSVLTRPKPAPSNEIRVEMEFVFAERITDVLLTAIPDLAARWAVSSVRLISDFVDSARFVSGRYRNDG